MSLLSALPSLRSSGRALRLLGAVCLTAGLAACASSVSLNEPFEGTPWRLVQLDGQTISSGLEEASVPRLQFDANAQRVSGASGCNALNGSYQRNGDRLRIGPLASTRRACMDSGLQMLEQRFLAVLNSTVGYDLRGAQLSLLDNRGMPLAVFDLGLREDALKKNR